MVVPFMMLAQSRMHGLKKKTENGMMEPDVDNTSGFLRYLWKRVWQQAEKQIGDMAKNDF